MAETPFIDKFQLLCELDRLKNTKTEQYRVGINAARDAVLNMKTADVAPVRHGRWIHFPACLAYKGAYCDEHIVCSVCEAVFDIMDNCTEKFNYCPECGAKMEEEK